MRADAEKFNAEILRYLNRLSDLCWLLARYAEHLHDEAESTGENGNILFAFAEPLEHLPRPPRPVLRHETHLWRYRQN